jgi:hypothetical protein
MLLGFINKGRCLCGEAVIARDTDEIVDTMTFTPAQHFQTAEPRIRPQQDADLGPCLAQAFDQQGQNGPGMFGTIDPARAQVADQ